MQVKDAMHTGVTWVGPENSIHELVRKMRDEDIGDAIRIMEDEGVRHLPVINETKRMVGMLALGDIADCAPRDMSAEVMKAVSAHHP